jgi:hypothetical protein
MMQLDTNMLLSKAEALNKSAGAPAHSKTQAHHVH